MKRCILGIVCFSLCIVISGCIPIPIPGTQDPFSNRLAFIRPGYTTRSDVLVHLSNPYQKRLGENFFAYVGFESDTGVCLLTYGPAACMIGGTAHFIGIDFDDSGRVKQVSRSSIDISASNSGNPWNICLPSGICLDYKYLSMMIMAPPKNDAEAKLFSAKENACSIYLIGPQSPMPASLSLNLDGQNAGTLGSGTYLLWTPPAGLHTMYGQSLQGNAYKQTLSFLSVPCEQARLLFIQTDTNGNLNVLPELEGRKAVQASRRLLDAF